MIGKNKPAQKIAKQPLGFVLYRGPSSLDGAPIVVIATLSTSNIKTGNMLQTWILREDINPVEASKLGEDSSICGSCVHRHHNNGACYVNIGQAPNQIWKSYHKGRYADFDLAKHANFILGRSVRLGAYGDPAAAPFEAFEKILNLASGHTGYTHQINHKGFDRRFLQICMVSADTPKQALKYQAQGAKTFRVALAEDDLFAHEIECRADSDGVQCIDCGLCDGKTQSIAIAVHGSRSSRFKSQLIAWIAA